MNFHLTPNPEKSNDKISEKLKKPYFFYNYLHRPENQKKLMSDY